jgi:hypothetical protein
VRTGTRKTRHQYECREVGCASFPPSRATGRLELLRPGDALRAPSRLLRLARVDDQAALLEEGDRAAGRLLTRLSRSHRPQEPLHPGHGQEDAVILLALEGFVLVLACPPPDVQAEGVDRRAPVLL